MSAGRHTREVCATCRVPGGLLALAMLLLMLLALAAQSPVSAIAAEPTSGYSEPPSTPASGYNEPPSTPTPGSPMTETSPSQEAAKPEVTKPQSPVGGEKPYTAVKENVAKASALPFTGFDLREELGFGALLVGAGLAIAVKQRRHERR
jgi:hypothetical protein